MAGVNNMQALVDGMNAQWQRERSKTQLTLGAMIKTLEGMAPETAVCLGSPHSYRGYYCDLSFENEANTAGKLLAECREAMGQVFQGYKGGDFVMGALTPTWVASWGACGNKLMRINTDGTVETEADED